ncbi:MAG: response regulator transcription factor [Chloroflexi bacterium]|nr:response regulator transcription factor [Chloroflexota bacterium]
MRTMPSIVVAEDHEVIRRGLRALLESERDFNVIGEAQNGSEATALVQRLRPDVLVLDLAMPRQTGQQVARKVVQDSPATRIVVFSMHIESAYVLDALKAGAHAYVVKGSASDELIKAIRESLCGRRYLSPPLPQNLLGICRETDWPPRADGASG